MVYFMIRKNLESWNTELIGKQFGRLTVIEVQQNYDPITKKKNGFMVLCKCSCGKEKLVALNSLRKGLTKSCGCLSVENSKRSVTIMHQWFKDNPEKTKILREKAVAGMHKWQKEHPDEVNKNIESMLEKAKLWRKKNPDKAKQNLNYMLEQDHKWQREHPVEFKNIVKENIKKAHHWRKEHLDEFKAYSSYAISKAQQWHKEHPKESKRIFSICLEKSKIWRKEHRKEFIYSVLKNKRSALLERCSKEEKELYSFLCSLGYNVERQILVENHYFDFRINNFLIEYHGSVYHYTEYCNLDNPKSKKPPSSKNDKNYHINLRSLALRNIYNLIQVWDFDWQNRKEFIKNLIQEQLSEIADYKNYVEKDLLNNDYGFNIDGEQVESKPVWVATTDNKHIVTESYTKGRVLIYNSGYTKIV